MQHVESTLQGLVEFLFLNNKNNTKVYLNLPSGEDGIRNNHDLFVFLVDLLCKGIVLLYGDDQKRVPIETMTEEQTEYIISKLKNAGILMTVNVQQIETADNMTISMKPAIYKGETDELEDYRLRLISKNIEYTIKFEIMRMA